jgi:hypothetical protein
MKKVFMFLFRDWVGWIRWSWKKSRSIHRFIACHVHFNHTQIWNTLIKSQLWSLLCHKTISFLSGKVMLYRVSIQLLFSLLWFKMDLYLLLDGHPKSKTWRY